ncbi:MAG: hypothetical protein WC713_04280 [Candidatus Methylomirabilota bacterium]
MDVALAIRLANEHERDGTASNVEVTLALWASNARGEIENLRADLVEARTLLEKRTEQGANDHLENARLRLELLEARTAIRNALVILEDPRKFDGYVAVIAAAIAALKEAVR